MVAARTALTALEIQVEAARRGLVLALVLARVLAGAVRVLHRLVVDGDVGCEDVVVLTPHGAEHSKVRGKIGSFTLTEQPRSGRDIKLTSIYRFKGLDSKVVVVCEVDRFVQEDFTKLMYVACSRARTLLIVMLLEPSSTS